MAVPGKKNPEKFSSSASQASDEDLKIFCQPCDRGGPRLPAFGFCQDCNEHLCQSCYSHHEKAAPSRHHVLLDSGAMPKTSSSRSAHASTPDDLLKTCLKHEKKLIEYYCHDHKVVLCTVCVTLEHIRKSCHVVYIPDISGKVVDSKEFQDTLDQIDAIIQHCQRVKEECKTLTEKSNISVTEVLNEIKKYRQEINKRIDELENEVVKKAKALQQQNDQRLQTTETICDDVQKSEKTLLDKIKQSNTTKQADILFIELKAAQVEMKEHEASINELSTDVKAYNFKSNQIISTVLQKETSLGTLEEKTLSTQVQKLNIDLLSHKSQQKTTRKFLFRRWKSKGYSHQGEMCVKTTNDDKKCWISSMVLLGQDQLVAVGFRNTSVKMVDVNSKTVTSEITMSSWPWDITSTTSNQLAVTLPHEGKVQFLSATADNLSQTDSLKVDGACYGISYYQGKLIISYYSPAKLEILDTEGTVLTTVTSNENGEPIFMYPKYVQVNSDSIYVSDAVTKKVTMLNWDGQVTGSYGNLGVCQGLALSDDGTLYVCEQSKNSIAVITNDCRQRKVVIKDVNSPVAVCCCEKDHKLYISSNTETENDNFIRVFNKP